MYQGRGAPRSSSSQRFTVGSGAEHSGLTIGDAGCTHRDVADEAPAARVPQLSDLKLGAKRFNTNFWEEPLTLARSWAEVSGPTVPSVTANPAEFAAATFNDAGTVRLVSLTAMVLRDKLIPWRFGLLLGMRSWKTIILRDSEAPSLFGCGYGAL